MISKNHILEIRKKKGLAQMEVSVKAGCSQSKLLSIEKYGFMPQPDLRQRIAKALDVSEGEVWPNLQTVDFPSAGGCNHDTNE